MKTEFEWAVMDIILLPVLIIVFIFWPIWWIIRYRKECETEAEDDDD